MPSRYQSAEIPLHQCAPISELPSYISTMVATDEICKLSFDKWFNGLATFLVLAIYVLAGLRSRMLWSNLDPVLEMRSNLVLIIWSDPGSVFTIWSGPAWTLKI